MIGRFSGASFARNSFGSLQRALQFANLKKTALILSSFLITVPNRPNAR